MLATSDVRSSQMFVDAQSDYLRGNWFEAEAKLLQILHHHPRDAESLLLMVGVLRRTKRLKAAMRRLEHLELLETSAAWYFEIQRERKLIEQAMTQEEVA